MQSKSWPVVCCKAGHDQSFCRILHRKDAMLSVVGEESASQELQLVRPAQTCRFRQVYSRSARASTAIHKVGRGDSPFHLTMLAMC